MVRSTSPATAAAIRALFYALALIGAVLSGSVGLWAVAALFFLAPIVEISSMGMLRRRRVIRLSGRSRPVGGCCPVCGERVHAGATECLVCLEPLAHSPAPPTPVLNSVRLVAALRWTAVLPCAWVAGRLAQELTVLLALAESGSASGLFAIAFAICGAWAGGIVFVLVGVYTAPSHRRLTAGILGATVVLWSGLQVMVFLDSGPERIMVILAVTQGIGGALVAGALVRQPEFVRGQTTARGMT